ncbi:MAG TPA: multicopper oxidase domain-containing protein [Acidimicrobiia bacterium]|nr:multicopper oxidase domain-containing protein [Acidimicrobiia bacterium]
MADQRQDERSSESLGFAWAAFFVAIAAFVAAIGSFGFAATRDSGGGGGASSSGPPQIVNVTLADITMTPKETTVAGGRPVEFHVQNKGAMQHDFWLTSGAHTDMISPGKTATLKVDAVADGAMAYCNVPGHRAAGMEMMIHVQGAAAGGSSTGGTATASDAPKIDFSATSPDAFEARDPKAPVPSTVTEHKLTLDVIEKDITVAPGITQHMWTFNGTVPGPILRGKVGDIFTVTLVNKGTIAHSIDFHASKVAWSDEMRSIQPGQSLVYRYVAKYAGIFMYHCGTAPTLHHIGNGMYGAVIIDPPDLAPVAHEYALVQSELYLGPQGREGDLAKMKAGAWDAVVFNGYVNQYKDRPIQVQPNERIRVWVLDAGPSENSSFHIVGTIFDTVFKEGNYLLRPGPGQGGSQALDLQPAQGGFVEFTFDEVGYYPIVTHKFMAAAQGALGLFRAGDAKLPAGMSH